MDDLLQEVFLQVFRSLPSVRGDSQLSTWIHRIAIRVAYRHLAKARKAGPVLEVQDIVDEHGGPDMDLIAREGVRRFYEVLGRLSPAARIAFVLFEVEGQSVAEVAEQVGASLTATKLRIWRARGKVLGFAKDDPILKEFLDRDVGETSQ